MQWQVLIRFGYGARSAPATIALSCALAALCAGPARADEGTDFFERKIRPVLVQHCYECHSAEAMAANKFKGGLRLDTREGTREGGDSGPAVVPGKPDEGELIGALKHESFQMPPSGKLGEEIVADFVKWIEMGAPDPREGEAVAARPAIDYEQGRKHWAFQPLRLAPPRAARLAWGNSEIDRYVLAELESHQLRPAPPADKRTLIRRATFDLTGLPPTVEEVAEFLADDSPEAFARVVDRLLASPAYGQRWSRHWLDVVRYTDSYDARIVGKDNIMDCNSAWRYRDWVVDAFNDDLPYDQFLMRQIAGDILMAHGEPEVKFAGHVATGLLAIGNWGGGDADKEKLITDVADDQIDVVGRGMLGLTLGCARCHDHKFDPISTEDYYGLAGIFFSSHILENPGPKTDGPPALRIRLLSPQEIAAAERRLAELEEAEKSPETSAEIDSLRKLLEQKEAYAHGCLEKGCPQTAYGDGFHDARVHIRGRYDRLGEIVPRRFPIVLAGEEQPPITSGSGRLELARWVASRDNPLTARVMVNRLWQHHFGEGIVRTPGNFGKLGEPPTHPELLDYLALRLMERGWSIKDMHREIMLSAAYRQSSAASREALEQDPDNRFWGRMNRRRLDAESLRDSLLAVAGQLDAALGGPATRDLHSPRRTLYLMTIRSDQDGFRSLFDGADSTSIVDERTVSTVAPQALFLLNHPFVAARAEELARLAMQEAETDDARIDWLYGRLFNRAATGDEKEIGRALLQEMESWPKYCHVLLCANEFIYID